MLKGVLLGSVSALVLWGAVLAGVSLLVTGSPTGLAGTPPQAPVLRDQAETVPVTPEPLPERAPSAPAVETADAVTDQTSTARESVAEDVDLPAGSQFNRPREDGVVVTPDAARPARPDPVAVQLGRGDAATVAQPQLDTGTAAQPETSGIAAMTAPPVAGEAPVLPGSPSETPPRTFREVPIETSEGDAPATNDSILIEIEPAAAEPAPAVVETAPTNPITVVPEDEVVDAPRAETPEPEPEPATDPIEPRRIVLDSERAATEPVAEPEAEDAAPRPNLVVHAAEFDNPEGLPLFGVVIAVGPDDPVSQADLMGFDFPVTFAIDPVRPDAADVVRRFRAQGFEVVMLADALRPGGAAQDIAVAVEGALAVMPEAVAILDPATDGFVRDQAALSSILPVLAEEGMGLLTYPGGLNSGVATAERAGVPAAMFYRALDAEGERATVITRYLDRATFEATRDGAAIVIGRAQQETITALYSWRLGSRSDQVAIAPVSAILSAE
ncbi:divergent polysaccharide deacetylase family protein [uncultured Jannaschia sp.]|uniref:divergent polysaccharide deacetylase family protein n=1 Tax=uncultured Jannaschia sp. TaxID=293347 RepID=UPI002611C7B3|nr:divergent polysaccharide deacetylase family protein [uncultured Jannaschia sp.]